MNTYTLLKDRQRKEVDSFLNKYAFFAFSKEQYEQGMKKLGLHPGQESAIVRMNYTGGFVLKNHAADLMALLNRMDEERRAAMKDPATGYKFMYDMFTYELANHEYSYTGDAWETLDALGITEEDLDHDPEIQDALEDAKRDIMGAEI